MASPPNHAGSPSGMSPPGPSPASLPNKKRSSSTIDANPSKRRKPSQPGAGQPAHPLRQTSFPPPESNNTSAIRSPSVDATSHVSGSQVSGYTAKGTLKKKRGRKPKNAQGGTDGEGTPSLAGGSKAPTSVNGAGGDKDLEEEDDDDDDQDEMAVEGAGVMTEAQIAEEHRVRAMLVGAFDTDQLNRYENWRAARLTEAVVKRVVNATVSQSVPANVGLAVRTVTKVFAGDIIERSRQVQAEMMEAGEKQTDLPSPPSGETEGEAELKEPKRGPLRPEHLREAYRRHKLSGETRGVGVQHLWHAQQSDGVERFAVKTGKRLFR